MQKLIEPSVAKAGMKKKYYIGIKLMHKCIKDNCQHLATIKGDYCCVWCARRDERHGKRHTSNCEERLTKAVKRTNKIDYFCPTCGSHAIPSHREGCKYC